METVFYTVTSKLTLKNNTVWEQRVLQPPPTYWWHSFVLLVTVLGYTVHEALSGQWHEWVFALLLLHWLRPHLQRIYRLLFVNVWRWYVPLAEIRSVHLDPDYNEWEEQVRVVLRSGRQKNYLFRKSEGQAGKFAEVV
ncbi:MAG TPA: hypothetical protein VHK69_16685, partial [Chitinophagaceae bacterium]|nr:hypothetical protein [Chitinophagaceae bacterium]